MALYVVCSPFFGEIFIQFLLYAPENNCTIYLNRSIGVKILIQIVLLPASFVLSALINAILIGAGLVYLA